MEEQAATPSPIGFDAESIVAERRRNPEVDETLRIIRKSLSTGMFWYRLRSSHSNYVHVATALAMLRELGGFFVTEFSPSRSSVYDIVCLDDDMKELAMNAAICSIKESRARESGSDY